MHWWTEWYSVFRDGKCVDIDWFLVINAWMESIEKHFLLLTVAPIFPRRKTSSIQRWRDGSENDDCEMAVVFVHQIIFSSFETVGVSLTETVARFVLTKTIFVVANFPRFVSYRRCPQSIRILENLNPHYPVINKLLSKRHTKFLKARKKSHLNFLEFHPCCLADFSKNTDDWTQTQSEALFTFIYLTHCVHAWQLTSPDLSQHSIQQYQYFLTIWVRPTMALQY